METSPERLAILFRLYYDGKSTVRENDELFTLIKNAKDDAFLAQLIQDAWESLDMNDKPISMEQSESILNSILNYQDESVSNADFPTDKIRPIRWLRYVAAASVILIALGVFFKYKKPDNRPQTATVRIKSTDVPPGGNRAMLTLADGSTILLDSAANGLLAKQGSTDIRKTNDGQLVYASETVNSAAVLPQINTLSTPKGGQYHIVLPDGSKVWLNASSSIRFPAVFTGNERKVEITGEVFFEVTKDKTKPFKVLFGDSEVEVLGTSFNIMAYTDEESSKTTLVEGSVSLKNLHANKHLKPGEQASVSSEGQIMSKSVDVDAAIAWKSGLFYFRDSGIEEIMRQAARWYAVDVVYRGKIPIRQFTGKVSRNVNISELLTMLRYAGVNCRLEDDKIIVSS